MKNAELTHAKMSQVFVHAPLFRSFAKGEQKRQKLDVTYDVGDTIYRFWGPEPLGTVDLRVLQGLVAVATATRYTSSGVKSALRDGRKLRENLCLFGKAEDERVVAVRFILSTFALLIGYERPSGDTLNRLRESLERLSAVTVLVTHTSFRSSFRIVSKLQTDARTGEAVVGLNPEITAAILRKNGFLRLDLADVRKLNSDAARLLHSRLHWINPGQSRPVSLEILCSYVYGDISASASAASRRKSAVREALEELESSLNWRISNDKPALFKIQRPLTRPIGKHPNRPITQSKSSYQETDKDPSLAKISSNDKQLRDSS